MCDLKIPPIVVPQFMGQYYGSAQCCPCTKEISRIFHVYELPRFSLHAADRACGDKVRGACRLSASVHLLEQTTLRHTPPALCQGLPAFSALKSVLRPGPESPEAQNRVTDRREEGGGGGGGLRGLREGPPACGFCL